MRQWKRKFLRLHIRREFFCQSRCDMDSDSSFSQKNRRSQKGLDTLDSDVISSSLTIGSTNRYIMVAYNTL